MLGLEKIIDWLISLLADLLPFFIIKEYQQAILLRAGIYTKTYGKGFHLKIPLLDEVIAHHVTMTTLNLTAQSLVTKDNKNIVVKAIIKYKIADVKTFLIEVFDAKDAMSDITQGIIKGVIMTSTWAECTDSEMDNTITKKVRNEVKKFGISVELVTLTDIAEIRTIKLINQSETLTNG